jgi:hypothetical protein
MAVHPGYAALITHKAFCNAFDNSVGGQERMCRRKPASPKKKRFPKSTRSERVSHVACTRRQQATDLKRSTLTR